MTVTRSEADAQELTLTIETEFAASAQRIWQLWADPRQIEQWWGPPGYPATFHRHEFEVGGQSRYFMTGPSGNRSHGWFRYTAVVEPLNLEFDDGFADDDGEPLALEDAAHVTVTIEPTDTGTRMSTVTRFRDTEQMEAMLEMGMQEGMAQAMGQIDALLVA